MTALLWLLILAGPFLAVAPVALSAAPQIPGFWGRRPVYRGPGRPVVDWGRAVLA